MNPNLHGVFVLSDDPKTIKAIMLQDADPELRKQFLEMVKDQLHTHELQKSHRCWYIVPTPTEYERMRAILDKTKDEQCPKCGKGRLVVSIFRGNLGDSLNVVCRWGVEGCDFEEYVSDPE